MKSKQVINKFSPDFKGIAPKRGFKIKDSLNGWRYIWRFDPTTTIKLGLGLIISALLFYFQKDIAPWYIVSTLAMADTNYGNSSVEQLCDYLVGDEYDEKIKTIKDYAAAKTNLPLLIWMSFSLYSAVVVYNSLWVHLTI